MLSRLCHAFLNFSGVTDEFTFPWDLIRTCRCRTIWKSLCKIIYKCYIAIPARLENRYSKSHTLVCILPFSSQKQWEYEYCGSFGQFVAITPRSHPISPTIVATASSSKKGRNNAASFPRITKFPSRPVGCVCNDILSRAGMQLP